MYNIHNSLVLQDLFSEKPYQGQVPQKASILILGLDANYSVDIESSSIFDLIKEYHYDGVKFWKKYGVHHPFLMRGYKSSGYLYHDMFRKLDIDVTYADKVSFIELLSKPTQGKHDAKLFKEYVCDESNKNHLRMIESLFVENTLKKIVYITKSTISNSKLKDISLFWNNLQKVCRANSGIELVRLNDHTDVYVGYHFSYNRFNEHLTQAIFFDHLQRAGDVMKKY